MTARVIVRVLGLASLLLLAGLVPAQDPAPIEIKKDVVYGTGGGRPLKMHLLTPGKSPEKPMPVVVWIHGGGWQNGSRDSGLKLLEPFARQGYFCASIEYRLSKEATFPAQIEDCKAAIRFLRSKAKDWNLNPDAVGVWGSSAGGHLCALLGTSGDVKELEGQGGNPTFSSRVQAVCDFCGPSDLARMAGKADSPITRLLGGPVADKTDAAKSANPITHATKDDPPFLIVHGDKDATVPLNQSEILVEALKKAGVAVELKVVAGAGHNVRSKETEAEAMKFFDRILKR